MKSTVIPVLIDSIGCPNGQVAEEAEAMAAMRLLLIFCDACGSRMMPRRPDCTEGIACLRLQCGISCATHHKAAMYMSYNIILLHTSSDPDLPLAPPLDETGISLRKAYVQRGLCKQP